MERFHISLIKTLASAATAFGETAADAVTISSNRAVIRKRRVISAGPPGNDCAS
jgi:hypothetical protein